MNRNKSASPPFFYIDFCFLLQFKQLQTFICSCFIFFIIYVIIFIRYLLSNFQKLNNPQNILYSSFQKRTRRNVMISTLEKLDYNLFCKIYDSTHSNKLIESFFFYIHLLSKYFFAITYAIFLIYIYVTGYLSPYCILIPFFTLVLSILLRQLIKRPRPYYKLSHKYSTLPNKTSYSCPSNHTMSSLIISFCIYTYFPYIGVCLIFLSILIAYSRIACGFHFPFDILTSFLICFIIVFIYFGLLS